MGVHTTACQHSTTQGGHYRHAPQPPPSSPMEESKCSLPSISRLLGIDDVGWPASRASPDSISPSPRVEGMVLQRRGCEGTMMKAKMPGTAVARPQEIPFANSSCSSSNTQHPYRSRNLLPNPPMETDRSYDDNHSSPLTKSSGPISSVSCSGGRIFEATPPLVETDTHRIQLGPPAIPRAQGYFQEPTSQQTLQSQPILGSYRPTIPASSAPRPQIFNLHYQQALPQAFPPIRVALPFAPASSNSLWQHHHYMSTVHGICHPKSQYRYFCSTCNKAFSRPSTLRTHCHSHTGEKPFICPNAGCGKAFSVRSNMIRHEKSCHSYNIYSGHRPMRS